MVEVTARVGKTYMALIRRHPLRPIGTEAEYDRAIAVLNELIDRPDRDADATDYLAALATLIERYEEDHDPIPSLSGPDMLRWLIEDRGLTQSEVAADAGLSASTISEVLAGKRGLGTKHVRALAAYFRLDPGLFLGGTGGAGGEGGR